MSTLDSSFRDPSGFVFRHDGIIYRQVNDSYAHTYDALMESGLYARLVERGLLVAHEEVSAEELGLEVDTDRYKVIRPQQIPYVSYPYEWCFSALKQAAMVTLKIQHEALKHGFVLKDASAYNVQYLGVQPVFIDTLSFEPYREGEPWVAYKQFCQHFLAPLALMSHVDVSLSRLLSVHIDGIPLPLASKLLPLRTRASFALSSHIHMHARMQADHADDAADKGAAAARATLSKKAMGALIESLASAVDKLVWKMPATEWGDYYANTNYSDEAGAQKRQMVSDYLAAIPETLKTVQDLGANTGDFSRIAAAHCEWVISQDIDPVAVELNFQRTREKPPENLLPLVQDLSSPSPAIGWANVERDSFVGRGQCDALLVLALVHHLAISNNVPLPRIAGLFAEMTRWLVIEFVPKSDSQVERLLATREDVFPNYTIDGFEAAFTPSFEIVRHASVPDSERTLYLMRRR